MAFVCYNPNPLGKLTGDCTIRALSKILNKSWDQIYVDIFVVGFREKDMMDKNSIWGMYLDEQGFIRKAIPDTCPYCYTIDEFTKDHPKGKYILATGTHVVAVVDGDYYDAWDSGDKIPIYYWIKENQ